MQYKDYREAIGNIDWNLLQLQKITLEKLLHIVPLDTNIFEEVAYATTTGNAT